jgi:hypothetical protein
VLQIKEHAPIPFPSIVFIFGLAVKSIKELGGVSFSCYQIIDEVLNIMARCEIYSFLDGYFIYHHISITLKEKYKTSFVTN